ncbi:winged helix-turn-helix transcriptional regulator [Amycolatopsis sp. NPDC048633]|uniref:winged helix-turn-helix transcriptional regulator n=1 Tax=Amycolatopsis sp. NPDC048633 TaxID=3157095 RepID=UPI0033C04119
MGWTGVAVLIIAIVVPIAAICWVLAYPGRPQGLALVMSSTITSQPALELVGERWALLIVRDLSVRPRRYTDLLDGLPGIPTNVLSTRLKELEQGGVVERQVAPAPQRASSTPSPRPATSSNRQSSPPSAAGDPRSWGTPASGRPSPRSR